MVMSQKDSITQWYVYVSRQEQPLNPDKSGRNQILLFILCFYEGQIPFSWSFHVICCYHFSLNLQVYFVYVWLLDTTFAKKTYLEQGKSQFFHIFLQLINEISKIFSDPYVRIDLVANNGEQVIDSVLTRTKKRVI